MNIWLISLYFIRSQLLRKDCFRMYILCLRPALHVEVHRYVMQSDNAQIHIYGLMPLSSQSPDCGVDVEKHTAQVQTKFSALEYSVLITVQVTTESWESDVIKEVVVLVVAIVGFLEHVNIFQGVLCALDFSRFNPNVGLGCTSGRSTKFTYAAVLVVHYYEPCMLFMAVIMN